MPGDASASFVSPLLKLVIRVLVREPIADLISKPDLTSRF